MCFFQYLFPEDNFFSLVCKSVIHAMFSGTSPYRDHPRDLFQIDLNNYPIIITDKYQEWYFFNFSVSCRYLNNTVGIHFPPDQMWHCTIAMTVVNISLTCSNLLLVSMTFDRFYSIIMPHKAASYNTVK